VPTLSISYAEKSDVLMTSVGMGAFCHAASGIDVDRLRAQLSDLERSQDQVRNQLSVAAAANRKGVDQQFDAIEGLLTSIQLVQNGSAAPVGSEVSAQP
jgi:polysaccharide pyruvyl transferase WcaK-like protein